MNKITPCLWFASEAEEAATFYTSVFPNSEIHHIDRFGEGAPGEPGSVLAVNFSLNGTEYCGLNGASKSFNETISFQVECEDQAEIDHFWTSLTEGGAESRCGWLVDRYGVSWQINPSSLGRLMNLPDPAAQQRVVQALMSMNKIVIADLEAAGVSEPGVSEPAAE